MSLGQTSPRPRRLHRGSRFRAAGPAERPELHRRHDAERNHLQHRRGGAARSPGERDYRRMVEPVPLAGLVFRGSRGDPGQQDDCRRPGDPCPGPAERDCGPRRPLPTGRSQRQRPARAPTRTVGVRRPLFQFLFRGPKRRIFAGCVRRHEARDRAAAGAGRSAALRVGRGLSGADRQRGPERDRHCFPAGTYPGRRRHHRERPAEPVPRPAILRGGKGGPHGRS